MKYTRLEYLGKTDIDKSFKKLKNDKTIVLNTDYKNSKETIKELTELILSKYNDFIKVLKGNLQEITNKYKAEYIEYVEEKKEQNKRRYGAYTTYYSSIMLEDEYINNQINYRYRSDAVRFRKYTPTKEAEESVLYFNLERAYNSHSNFSFNFCVYYNSEHILCLDMITIKSKNREKDVYEFDTVKISVSKVLELLETFVVLNIKGEENYKKRQIKLKDNKIKKEKISQLKRKAGIINVKKILDEIDLDYTILEMYGAFKINIALNKGITTIKVPKKNLNESLPYLSEFVEAVLKANKLNIYFKHLNI